MEKERNVRKDLNSIGLNTNWLLSKDERTALEDRVLQRLLPKEEKSFYEEDGLQVDKQFDYPALERFAILANQREPSSDSKS